MQQGGALFDNWKLLVPQLVEWSERLEVGMTR
jgi:hypothetical protein